MKLSRQSRTALKVSAETDGSIEHVPCWQQASTNHMFPAKYFGGVEGFHCTTQNRRRISFTEGMTYGSC